MTVDINQIMKYLPHRYPFLLLDKVIDIVKGESATGIKNVTINEPFFQGHFPNHPIMPGVLIIEAMAQAAAVLVMETVGQEPGAKQKLVYFTSIENAKFRKPVLPGDQLHLKVKLVKSRGPLYKFDVVAEVNNEVVTEASIGAMMMDNA